MSDSGSVSFVEFDKAVDDLATAAMPLVHQVIDAIHSNLDPVSSAAKDLLAVANRHAEPLLKAGAKLASAGVRQAATLSKLQVSDTPAKRGAQAAKKSYKPARKG